VAAVASEVKVTLAARPLVTGGPGLLIEPRGSTRLGISFRPLQAEALGLDPRATLHTLLGYPFDVIRVAAYWDRIEGAPGRFDTDHLDAQVDAAEAAGKQIILCVGAVKAFGYPEFFVPPHHRKEPLPEGKLVTPATHPALLDAAVAHVVRVVARYRNRPAIMAWQVEHEAVDPLGIEHSWRLSESFVRREVDAVRSADPSRPVMMNGFLPTSLPVGLQQWWRTRDQGDSLAVAPRMADMVGIDFYPRHALVSAGPLTVYLDGSRRPWQQGRRRRLARWAAAPGRHLIIAEGQAEPWETVTTPPNPGGQAMYSCPPEAVIANYNQCLRWPGETYAYLFWGAEYWVARQQQGDTSYLEAFARICQN